MLIGIDFELCSYQPGGFDLASIYMSYLKWKKPYLIRTDPEDIISNLGPSRHLIQGYRDATKHDLSDIFPACLAIKIIKDSNVKIDLWEKKLKAALMLLEPFI
jgi:hypothetical protein